MGLEFNASGHFFSVSYWQPLKEKISSEMYRSGNCVKVFKMKTEKTINTEEAFYEEKDVINIRE